LGLRAAVVDAEGQVVCASDVHLAVAGEGRVRRSVAQCIAASLHSQGVRARAVGLELRLDLVRAAAVASHQHDGRGGRGLCEALSDAGRALGHAEGALAHRLCHAGVG